MTASLSLNPAKTVLRLKTLEKYIFLLLVFFLPTQLGKHFWPEFSLVAGMRIDYLSPTLFFTDVLFVLFVVVRTIRAFASSEKKYWGKRSLVILITIAILPGFIFSERPELVFFGMLRLLECIAFGMITFSMVTSSEMRKKTLWVFAASMLTQSCLAIIQFYNQGSLGGLWYYIGERTFSSSTPGIANASLDGTLVLRPYATLPHPNVLAAYLFLGMLYFASGIERYKVARPLVWMVFVISTTALILTLSRSVLLTALGAGLFLLIHAVLRRRHASILLHRVLLGVSLLCIVFVFSSLLMPRFFGSSLFEEAVIQRKDLLVSSLHMAWDHPFFGVGLQHFLVLLPKYQYAEKLPLFVQPVHSVYALILAELGILGLGLFIFFLYQTYKRIRHIAYRSPLPVALFFSLLILSSTDHYFITLQQGRLLFGFILGYLWKLSSTGVEKISE